MISYISYRILYMYIYNIVQWTATKHKLVSSVGIAHKIVTENIVHVIKSSLYNEAVSYTVEILPFQYTQWNIDFAI